MSSFTEALIARLAARLSRPVRRPEVAWGALATWSLVIAASAGCWLALVLLLRALS